MIIESLERRCYLLASGAITINGNNDLVNTDQFEFYQVGSTITFRNIRTGAIDTGTGITSITVNLGDGNDYVRFRDAGANNPVFCPVIVNGGNGDDTIYGGNGNDTLRGDAGNDRMQGRAGSDSIVGGTGLDTADFLYCLEPIHVSLDGQANDGRAGETDNVQTDAVIGTISNDIITGDSAANVLDGNAGNDQIGGRGGNDTITGGDGIDSIWGEDGNDWLSAKDKKVDQVSDGPGTDSAVVDQISLGDPVNDAASLLAAVATPGSIGAAISSFMASSFFSASFFSALEAPTGPASLDPDFGAGSGVALPVSPVRFTEVKQIQVETSPGVLEDRILLAGVRVDSEFSDDFIVVRLNMNGTLDTAFGQDDGLDTDPNTRLGWNVFGFGTGNIDSLTGMVVDSEDKILLVGNTSIPDGPTSFVLTRLTLDGLLDTTFGDLANPEIDFETRTGSTVRQWDGESNAYATDVILQDVPIGDGFSEERYLLTGSSGDDGIIGRIDRYGDIDPSFTPYLYSSFEESFTIETAVEDEVTGNLWLGVNTNSTPFLVGIDASGNPISTETFLDASNPQYWINDLIVSGDRIIGVGETADQQGVTFAATIDSLNSTLKDVVVSFVPGEAGLTQKFAAVAIDKQGLAYAAGTIDVAGTNPDFVLYRFIPTDLAADPTFNNGSATVRTDIVSPSGFDDASAVTIQSDGRILLAGGVFEPSESGDNYLGAVVRYAGTSQIAENIISDEQLINTIFSFEDEDGIVSLPTYLLSNLKPQVVNGILTINGTDVDDIIQVTQTTNASGEDVFFITFSADYLEVLVAGVTGIVINGLAADDTIQIDDSISVPVTVHGGAGNDTIIVGTTPDGDGNVPSPLPPGAGQPVTLYGDEGNDQFQINQNSGDVDIFGVDDDDKIFVNATLVDTYVENGHVRINGETGINSVTIDGTGLADHFEIDGRKLKGAGLDISFGEIESLTVRGLGGDDIFDVLSTDPEIKLILNGGLGSDTFNVGPALSAMESSIQIIGGTNDDPEGELDQLNLDDTSNTLPGNGAIDSTSVTGFGLGDGVTYTQLESLQLKLNGGSTAGDDVTINSTHAGATHVDLGAGPDTVKIKGITGATAVFGGDGDDVFTIGSDDHTLSDIKGSLSINGDAPSASDVLNIDESGATANLTATVTSTKYVSSGFAGEVNFLTTETVNISTGSGNDTVHVKSTSITQTHINTNGGNDAINVSSEVPPTLGNVSAITGTLNIDAGSGRNALRVSDAASLVADANVVVTNNQITGLAPAAIGYTATGGHFGAGVIIEGGSGGNTFTIQSTRNTAGIPEPTIINSGNGADDVTVTESAPAMLAINGQLGADTINATAASSRVYLIGGLGNDTIKGGSGNDLIFGDNGRVYFRGVAGASDSVLGGAADAAVLDALVDDSDGFSPDYANTSDPSTGGDDSILAGSGNDAVFGGAGADIISGQNDADSLFGDSGVMVFMGGIVRSLKTSDSTLGGSDSIDGGAGADSILAGSAGDSILGGTQNDAVLGDNGEIRGDDGSSDAYSIFSTDAIGAGDTIDAGDGDDIVIGGAGGDSVAGGIGKDLIFGDNAKITRNSTLATTGFTSTFTAASDGGNDSVAAGAGDDTVIGGQGADRLLGEDDSDDLIGGHNVAGGDDGADQIDGGAGTDAIAGDNAVITRGTDAVSPLYRTLSSSQLQNNLGLANVSSTSQANPSGTIARSITILDHSASIASSKFGNDSLAGGAGNDSIFGQLGNDLIQGDAAITVVPSASTPSVESATDGDDYIEGNNGNDLIFGNQGQDDLIGGSSDQFGLTLGNRPDGHDTIFGGAGNAISINHAGDTSAAGHAKDADVILGDNANIFRIVSDGEFGKYNYDNYGSAKIIVRGYQLLDYSFTGAAGNVVGNDLLFGEAGDDLVHGQDGNDVLFGNAQDDNLFGGLGHDRIYGGAGDDGILGDEGLIFASRNGLAEPLNGLGTANLQVNYTLPGPFIGAVEFIAGQLFKSVELISSTVGGNDVVYGGLGNDFMHGGAGDDAMSGAEAQSAFYNALPITTVNPLAFNATTRKFAAYDSVNPFKKISSFLLNFEATASGNKIDDGKDRIFGDLGNDWLVGGTNKDRLFGGYGDDLLNGDDNLDTSGGLNNTPDASSYADPDFVVGGVGKDILIANTGADRLFDWGANWNTYLVPFKSFGNPTVNRTLTPKELDFLTKLANAAGADRNFTPALGEAAIVNIGESSSTHEQRPAGITAHRDTQGGPENDSAPASVVTHVPGSVAFAADLFDATKNSLYIYGYNTADVIDLRQKSGAPAGTVELRINNIVRATVTNVFRTYIFAGNGDDQITIQPSASAFAAFIYGEEGNDSVTLGAGAAYVDGGDGNDNLNGGQGRSVLIGGTGIDKISGTGPEEIVIGAYVDYLENLDAHTAILAEWTRTDQTYAQRIVNLRAGGGLSGGFALNASQIIDDAVKDTVNGGNGTDWFLTNSQDQTDRKTSGAGTETLN